ncbi:MAG: fimbrillin family protein, partial [Lepagella sp.]
MASCSQNETLEVNNDGNEILFGVSAENATRAADGELFSSTVKPANFTVYASYNNADFFPATGINVKQDTEDNTKWVTDGKTYYWPNTGAINFFAIRNGGTNTWNAAEGGSLTSDYTVPADVADQKDFIYAYASSEKTSDKVPLQFKHALSQVVFKAKNTDTNIEVKIDEVQVCGLKNTG